MNGPAVLSSGTLDVTSGSLLNFNGMVSKDGSVVEVSSGTISYVDPGRCLLVLITISQIFAGVVVSSLTVIYAVCNVVR